MFSNRQEAGELLAQELKEYGNKKNVLVLGIARGGVVVASEVARKLHVPLDILVIRKIGAPHNPELAIGAVGPRKTAYWDEELIAKLGVDKKIKNQQLRIKLREQREREKTLRKGRKSLNVSKKVIILVDDGIATGSTVMCSQEFLRKEKAHKIILAVPVIARDTLREIIAYFDDIKTLEIPREFHAVGEFYEEFPQIEDKDVIKLLR